MDNHYGFLTFLAETRGFFFLILLCLITACAVLPVDTFGGTGLIGVVSFAVLLYIRLWQKARRFHMRNNGGWGWQGPGDNGDDAPPNIPPPSGGVKITDEDFDELLEQTSEEKELVAV